MVFKTLKIIIGAQSQLFRFKRGMLQKSVVSYTSLLILCSLLCLVNCGPRLIDVLPKLIDYDACGSCKNGGFQDDYATYAVSDPVLGSTKTVYAEKDVSGDPESFRFPSTFNEFTEEERNQEDAALDAEGGGSEASLHMKSARLDGNSSWSLGFGIFELINGITLSCSLDSQEASDDISLPKISDSVENCREHVFVQRDAILSFDKNMEIKKSPSKDCPLQHVDIMSQQLDWGHKYLFFPSLAFLTVKNTCNKSLLSVYEPYSTDVQFYPCNFREYLLRPGENASLCFVFLPTRLGMSSAWLVLQTSSGGFLVEARGIAIESPYKIQSLVGLDVSSGRWWSRNLSLFNPFDEAILVEEVTAWIAVSVGNNTLLAEANCKKEDSLDSGKLSIFGANNCLNLENGHSAHPVVAVRPLTNWVVSPKETETFMEIGFLANGREKVMGSICIRLLRPLHGGMDTIMVPFEANLNERTSYDDGRLVSASVALIKPCDASKTASISISLRNSASYLLKIIKINEASENEKVLQIKYSQGLLIFPGFVTEVAVVTYGLLNFEYIDQMGGPDIKDSICLQILTNDSVNPLIEIPCWELVRLCPLQEEEHSSGHENLSARITGDNAGSVSLTSSSSRNSSPLFKEFENTEADEYVMQNWRIQGTMSNLFVLNSQEVVFPMVPVSKHVSQLIHVRNPSDQPVIMQLILNSGELVGNCKVTDAYLQLPSASSYVHKGSERPFRYGFTLAESARTEAYVQPYETTTFGPILFHPSDRCEWRSSALIRNNLSGVESLSLRGFGGSHSLILLEGSEPVERMEFNLNLLYPLNNPSSDRINIEGAVNSCRRPLPKVLLALNTGDLPVEVRRIDVSGVECALDGFLVHDCGGFSLNPGESKEFLISYHAGFSAPAIQRDLELILATGILVIPMKATMPIYMLGTCWKTMLWVLVRKWSVVIAALLIILMFCMLVPQILTLGLSDLLIKGKRSSIDVVNCAAKPSCMQKNQRNENWERNENFAVPSKTHCLVSAVVEEKMMSTRPRTRLPSGNSVASDQGNCSEYFEPSRTDTKTSQEGGLLLSVPVKSARVEGFDKQDEIKPSNDSHEQPGNANLTIKTGKDRVRRRRRRKGGNAATLSGPLELSSSQSSNSTPSSPLSPCLAFTPRRISHEKERPSESQNLSIGMAGQLCDKGHALEHGSNANSLGPDISLKGSREDVASCSGQSSVTTKKTAWCMRPVLLPSATFPGTSRSPSSTLCPSGLSPSCISVHARAPGSKLYSQETSEAKERARLADRFTYDIWGNHLSGLHLMPVSNEVSHVNSSCIGNDSHSFFLRGPQSIMKISRSRSVSDYEQG